MELINLMPMLIKIVELDFSWPSFNSGLTGWRSDFTVAGTANVFHKDSPPNQYKFTYILNYKVYNTNYLRFDDNYYLIKN